MAREKINFDELEDTVAVAMYLEFINDGKRELDSDEISEILQNKFPKNAITLLLEDLTKRGVSRKIHKFQLVKDPMDPLDIAAPKYRLTKNCIQYIEDLPDDTFASFEALCLIKPDISNDVEKIPASDRIVKRSDNEETWSHAAEGVTALYDTLVEANDHGELDDDEFEQKLSEVRALQIMLDAPQVQWDVLDQFTNKTVKYLAMKFVDKAIGIAASGLLVYLTALR